MSHALLGFLSRPSEESFPMGGIIVAVVGLVPLLAGLFDFCAFAPLVGAPMSDPKIRSGK